MRSLFSRSTVLSPYALLGVEPTCSDGELQAAYRLKAKLYHPDRARDEGEKFRVLKEAYETLKCPVRRAALNRELGIKVQFGGNGIQSEFGEFAGGVGLARKARFSLFRFFRPREILLSTIFSRIVQRYQNLLSGLRTLPLFQGKVPVPVLVHNETTLSDVLGDRVIVRPGVCEPTALQQAVMVCGELVKSIKFVNAKVITVDVVNEKVREQRNILLLVPRKAGYQVPVVHSVALRGLRQSGEGTTPLRDLVVTWLGDGPFCQALNGNGTSIYPS